MCEMKKCSKCGEEFPLTTEYFKTRDGSKDGFRGACLQCFTKQNRLRYEKNKDHIQEYQKQYRLENEDILTKNKKQNRLDNIVVRLEHGRKYSKIYYQENKVARAEYSKKYNEENKEFLAERRKIYRGDNKEKIRESSKIYRDNNKEKLKEIGKSWLNLNRERANNITQRYRAKKRNLPHTLTPRQWDEIKVYFENRCAYCGENKPLAREHVLPVASGGEFTHDNIICACRECNSSKGIRNLEEWYHEQPFYSPKREQKILAYLGYFNGIQQLSLI